MEEGHREEEEGWGRLLLQLSVSRPNNITIDKN